MKKIKVAILFIITFQFFCFSQDGPDRLKFDTKYYNAVDKWVSFPPSEKDSSHIVGFIYIDQMAGFTFRYENTFKINNQKLVASAKDGSELNSMIIHRLAPNTKPIAVLNPKQIEQLGLEKSPEWLKIYKSNSDSVAYLKQIGYHYNHVGASTNALEPLLKAYKIDPHYDGLEFELGFAYNATQQFEKAIVVLEEAIKKRDSDQLLYKELGYALIHLKQFDKAERLSTQGIEKAKDDSIKAEMAINMCAIFLQEKNKDKYNKWLVVAKKYVKEGSQFAPYLDYFESEWAKQE